MYREASMCHESKYFASANGHKFRASSLACRMYTFVIGLQLLPSVSLGGVDRYTSRGGLGRWVFFPSSSSHRKNAGR